MSSHNRLINTRTIVILSVMLSSIAVIRQTISTQVIISSVSLLLLLLNSARAELFRRLFGRFKHLWSAVLIIFILQVLFRRDGDTIYSLFLLKITDNGLFYGLTISMRLINLILISGLLFSISSSQYMLAFKSWRVPFEISFLITTVIRFIPDYYRLFIAYRETIYLRNINIKKLSVKNKLSALTSLLIPVLSGCLSEVKSRAIALDLKGFRLYNRRTSLYECKLSLYDYIIQGLAVIFFVVMMI